MIWPSELLRLVLILLELVSAAVMSPSPNSRDEVRKKAYKHAVDGDEARRKREDKTLDIQKSRKDESLSRRRRDGTPTQQQVINFCLIALFSLVGKP